MTTTATHCGLLGTNRLYWIWLDLPDRPRILFNGELRNQSAVHDLVVRLSRDLRCAAETVPLD